MKDGVNQVVGKYVTYKVVARDDTFTVSRIDGRNEEELHELIDASISDAGRIGIGACIDRGKANYRTFFDNFRVESDELALGVVNTLGKLPVAWGMLKSRY